MSSTLDLTEAQIAVHWKEEDYFHPQPHFIQQANLKDVTVDKRFSLDHFPQCFDEYAELLTWYKKWDTTLDSINPPFWKWFTGGTLNASYNCIDRHLPTPKGKAAFIFVPELEDEPTQVITYQELDERVNEVAAVLQDFCGLKTGDRVTIHMPLVPELPITMLACARLGIIHSVVFGGFSGVACGQRVADSGSHVLITMDGYYRSGQKQDHKEKADIAVDTAKQEENVVVERCWCGAAIRDSTCRKRRWSKGAISSWTTS
jgi:acetyl-CoA synthetase